MSYIITTDTMADLPESYVEKHGLTLLSLSYTIDGVTYSRGNDLPAKEFYQKMRSGSIPMTSQLNPETAKETFSSLIEQTGSDIIHIAFSSGLSGSCASAQIAANELSSQYPHRKIAVIDSLCASLGEGLLVYKAMKLKEEGKSFDEVCRWLEENKLHLCHNFTVDDLIYLHRGGRVSKATAIVGGVLQIKPVLHVDDNGHLVPVGKVRGRRKSLDALIDNMDNGMGSFKDKNDIVFISHGDCEEDAIFVASEVERRFGITSFIINFVGPTIGAHSGPGTVALFYMGDKR